MGFLFPATHPESQDGFFFWEEKIMNPKESKRRVQIADTTLRDGEQAPGCHLNPDQKFEIAAQLAELHVDAIEAGFPVSSPAEFDAVSRIASTIGAADDAPVIVAFGRSMDKDIDACWKSIGNARRPRIHTFIAASDIHLEHKLRMSRQQALDMAVAGVRRAKRYTDDVQFTPEDGSRADRAYLQSIVKAVIEAGATIVNVPDTVGYATPWEFADLVSFLKTTVPGADRVAWSVHCHDDLGMAVANSLAAVRAGVDQVEGTVNGIGERAGNCALEEVIMAIHTRGDGFAAETAVRTQRLWNVSQSIVRATGMAVQPNKAVVGANAFAHASGIHQDGMLKNRSTYEIMKPEDVGAPGSSLPLTNRSGRRALATKVRQMGLSIPAEKMADFFDRFKRFADGRKNVNDQDLRGLMDAL
jgi:2-isopropylmalate synthase